MLASEPSPVAVVAPSPPVDGQTSPVGGSTAGGRARWFDTEPTAATLERPVLRPGPARASRGEPVDFHALLGQATLNWSAKRPKRRRFRRVIGRVLVFLVVFGLAGGAIYAGKTRVLDRRWDPELEQLAELISDERGLEWKRRVALDELPAEEFGARLAGTWLGVDDEQVATLIPEWRAMGLAEGMPSLAAIGAAAVSTRPAFYDPADGRIHVAAGAPAELRRLALGRALAMALLDQHYGWSRGPAADEAGARAAVLALFDADARATAFVAIGPDASDEERLIAEVRELGDEYSASAVGAPRMAVDLVSAGGGVGYLIDQLGLDERNELLGTPVGSGAGVFDLARALDHRGADLGAEAGQTRGLLYWYYVLAGRIPSEQAWQAALTWQGDRVVPVVSAGPTCVQATIATTAESQPTMLSALQQWQAAAPTAAATTVSVAGPEALSLVSCDPGAEQDTVAITDMAVFGGSIDEARFVGLIGADDPVERACVVNGIRGFGITAVVASGDDIAIQQAVDAFREVCVR